MGLHLKNDIPSDSFLKKICSIMHSVPTFSQRGEGVGYIDAREKMFWNAVSACTFLTKNFQMAFWHIPSQKYPWISHTKNSILGNSDVLILFLLLHH
jgi:hypothetical protein